MKIVCIFEDRLYAFKYRNDNGDGVDEFERLFDAWQDPEFLEQFFEANKNDLQSGFFDPIPTVEQAILITKAEAKRLEKLLRDVVLQRQPLHDIFKPLSVNEDRWPFPRQKVYGLCYKSWLRIYAIKIAHRYYVTGGAIKLTKAMQDRVHTNRELQKIQRCFSFFEEEGIVDVEGAKELDL